MDDRTQQRLTNDILACLAVARDERLTVTDLIGALRDTHFRGADRGGAEYRWSFSNNYALTTAAESLGFAVFDSVNERNQRGQYIALSEVHPFKPEPKATEGFVIVARFVDHWGGPRSVLSRYSGCNRQHTRDLAHAKVYKTRGGAERAAFKMVKNRTRLAERFDPEQAVITVTEFLARGGAA
jgi:hypothetical protein